MAIKISRQCMGFSRAVNYETFLSPTFTVSVGGGCQSRWGNLVAKLGDRFSRDVALTSPVSPHAICYKILYPAARLNCGVRPFLNIDERGRR